MIPFVLPKAYFHFCAQFKKKSLSQKGVVANSAPAEINQNAMCTTFDIQYANI